MTTRNFYERKSVEATFLYAVQTGSTELATQALSELVSSGFDTKRLVLLSRLSPHPPILPFSKQSSLATIQRAIQDALRHGRIERAARLALSVEDLRSLLLSFSLNADWLLLLPGVPKDQVLLAAFKNEPLIDVVNTDAIGRPFSVDPRALAYWGVPSLSMRMGAPLVVTEADAAPWWKSALLRHGISRELQGTDDAIEAFYTECFPMDIPDEWSLEERKKSHGLVVPSVSLNPLASYFLSM